MPLEGDDHKNDPSGAGQQIAPNQGGESGSSLPPIVGPPNPPPTPSSENQRGKSDSKWRENTKLGLEIGGLLILLIYTLFSALQWAQIRWTNRLTREALNDNGQSLQATLRKMQGQIDEMHTLSINAGKQADRTKDLADRTKESVEQTSRLAKATEEANTNVIEADRPWMGGGVVVNKFGVNEKSAFAIVFTNSGRRPARIDWSAIRYDSFPSFPKDVEKSYVIDAEPSTNLVLPGQSTISSQVADFPLTPETMRLIESRQLTFYVYGEVRYRDIRTNESHWTHLCVYYIPRTKTDTDNGFRNCPTYNETDDK